MTVWEMGVREELHRSIPTDTPARREYTRKAFRMLPPLEAPRILDIGCGVGGPTLELARLSGGEVTGLDIDATSLRELERKAREEGLEGRVRTIKRSFLDMDFEEGSFDIVWSEGVVFLIGFERGLREWGRLVRPGGFLVLHEMVWQKADPPRDVRAYWEGRFPRIGTVEELEASIARCGLEPLGGFPLPDDFWWHACYGPMEEGIAALREKYRGDAEAQAILDSETDEVEAFRDSMEWYGSAFLLMKRPEK